MSTSPELTKGNDLDNIFTARTTTEIDGALYTLSNAIITMPDGIDLTRSTYTQNDSTGYWINEDALEAYDATTTGYVEQGGSGPGIVDTITYKNASYKISLSADTSWMLQLSLNAFSSLDAAVASGLFGMRAYTTVSPGIPIFRISTEDKKLYNNENRILTVADHITADMIPDGSITSDKLDWTTLDKETASQLVNLVIETATITQTTDVNGLWGVSTNYVTPSTGAILSVSILNVNATAQIICDQNRFTLRMRDWNLEHITNKSITATIYYLRSD